jgi:hypothetical protein
MRPVDHVQRFKTLVVKRGVSIGALFDSAVEDFDLCVGAASLCLQGGTLSEIQVNEALKHWLAGPGQFLDVDHVELRRWLVDMGLWERDGYGRAYQRSRPPAERFVDALGALSSIDQFALAANADKARADARAARKAAWQARATLA